MVASHDGGAAFLARHQAREDPAALESAADCLQHIPDEVLMQENGADVLLAAIQKTYKIYVEADLEIAVREAFYAGAREAKDSYTLHTAKRMETFREAERILKEKVPERLWWVIMKLGCNFSKEDYTKVHTWTKGEQDLEKFIEQVRFLDTSDDMIALRGGFKQQAGVRTFFQNLSLIHI